MGKKIKGLFGELEAAMKRNARRNLDQILRGETKAEAVAKAKKAAGEEIGRLKDRIAALEKDKKRLTDENKRLTREKQEIAEREVNVMIRANKSSLAITRLRREMAQKAAEDLKNTVVHPGLTAQKDFVIVARHDKKGGTYKERIEADDSAMMFVMQRLLEACTHGNDAAVTQVCEWLESFQIERNRKRRTNGAFSGNLEVDFGSRK